MSEEHKKYTGEKFSRKEWTAVWNQAQSHFQLASVIKIPNPDDTNTFQYFRLINDPRNPTPEDSKSGKTKTLGSGGRAKTKFAVPVMPLKDKKGEFVELDNAEGSLQIVRICKTRESDEDCRIRQRRGNDYFSQFYGVPVLHTKFQNAQKEWTSYTVFPYLGETLSSVLDRYHKKTNERKNSSYTTHLLDIKQSLQVGIALCQTLQSFCQKTHAHHNDAGTGNWLVQIKGNRFITHLIDFEMADEEEIVSEKNSFRNPYRI